VLCVHGISQHGAVFEDLAERLAKRGHLVVAVDLRGHGRSDRQPPWDTDAQAEDLIETLDALRVERASLLGHSFGGRLVARAATLLGERAERLILLDPALDVAAERAMRRAEIERLDWSFATVDGAINALLSNELFVAAPHDVVATFVREDLREGPDGRLRFSFCPSAAVVAWSEVARAAPGIARLPTLLVWAEASLADPELQTARYREALGDLLTAVTVPNGHNVLWESPEETIESIERFLASRD
jgi:lipase